MANRFYAPGEQRALKVNELFSAVAPRYDLINDLQSFGLHRYWKERLVRMARANPGTPALDLCCGTGDIALALARRGAAVVGLDFSLPMLAVAREKAIGLNSAATSRLSQAAGPLHTDRGSCCLPVRGRTQTGPSPDSRSSASVSLLCGDTLRIPFSEDTFDIITIGYGLRNLASLETGLREMHRVLKPGGRVLILDFGKPPNALWRAIYFGYLRLCVPVWGRVFCGNAATYAYILESLRHYPAQQGVADKMRELGLAGVRVHNLLGGVMSVNYGEKPG